MRQVPLLALAAAVALSAPAQAWGRNKQDDAKYATTAAERVDDPLVVEASSYAVFQGDVTALETDQFESVADIDAAMESLITHTPERLTAAWLAYAALVAAQTPEFVDEIRSVSDYYGRDAILTGLRNDPAYAARLDGANRARQSVLATATSDAGRIRATGEIVRMQAYSLQKDDWAKVRSGNNSARIAKLEAIALNARKADEAVLAGIAAPGAIGSKVAPADREVAMDAFWSAFHLGPAQAYASADLSLRKAGGASTVAAAPMAYDLRPTPRYENAVNHALTLAAFEAVGAAGDDSEAAVRPLLADSQTQACLLTARLHFAQCLAASAFRYEDPFCIAEHALNDVGDCFGAVAGG